MADITATSADFCYSRVAFYEAAQVKVADVVFQILDISSRWEEVWRVFWEAEVGKGSEILGGDQLYQSELQLCFRSRYFGEEGKLTQVESRVGN